jgi:murein DD-endopeptidase MepM/ murein hydrolase activator NlpD
VALAAALVLPLHAIVAPFRGSAAELLGGDPGRLHPLAGSRKLAHATRFEPRAIAAALRARTIGIDRPERLVPVGVCALLVAAAALSSLPPVGTANGGAAPTYGPRVVIAGLDAGGTGATSSGAPTASASGATGVDTATGSPQSSATGALESPAGAGLAYYPGDVAIPNTLAGPEVGTSGSGVFSTYTVVAGDTLGGVAKKFGVGLTTLYWANSKSLPDSESLRIGQQLVIPSVDGLVVVAGASDTIDSLAAKYKVDAQGIIDANHLSGSTIVAGDTLLIPGASGGAIPVPKVSSTGGGSSYTGGRLEWPTRGTISQYFSSVHPAIDIAARTGTPVVAAAAGTVIYAGWKTTGGGVGGGIVVWISHGGGLYTTYNHLSSEIVGVGQRVSAGQRIGSVGQTGVATGPHLHFEVWSGVPWGDWTTRGARNPLLYLR